MAGLIELEMGGTKKKDVLGTDVFDATATGYDPEKRVVDPSKETVGGQMDSLLATDSPYVQRARTRAAQTANQRGLLNSSMAAGAGEAAAIDASLPIAMADAGIYDTAARENTAAKNRSFEFGAGESNVMSRMGYGAELEKGLIGARVGAEKELIGAREGAESRLSAQQSAQQQAMAQVQAELEQGLITTREQADARLTQLRGEIESKLLAERTGAQSQLQAEAATQQADQTRLQAILESGLVKDRASAEQMLQAERAVQEATLQAQRAQQAFQQARLEGDIQGELQAQRAMEEAELQAQRANQQIDALKEQARLEGGLIAQRGTQDMALQTLRGGQAKTLAEIEASYKNLLQASDSAAKLYQTTQQAIAAIMADVNTSPEQKQDAVNAMGLLLESGLIMSGAIADIDLAGLLDFNIAVEQPVAAATPSSQTVGTSTSTGTTVTRQDRGVIP